MPKLRSGAASRAVLAQLSDEASGRDLTAGDQRYARGQDLNEFREAGREIVRDVFGGTALAEDDQRIGEVLNARVEIRDQWEKARHAFLGIGRILLRLKGMLSEDEFLALRRGTHRLFPFSDSLASKLMEIARAVGEGRIPEPQLPASYTTAYELAVALRQDGGPELAAARGLIRWDVVHSEVAALRRDLRRPAMPRIIEGVAEDAGGESGTLLDPKALARRREALIAEREQVAARLADLDGEIATLSEQLDLLSGQSDLTP